jgi:hypothetical protein
MDLLLFIKLIGATPNQLIAFDGIHSPAMI